MDDTESVRRVLTDAAKTGEVVRIVYRGGRQPGSIREIAPMTVSETEVLARDLPAGINKTFAIAKIELPAATTIAVAYDPNQRADSRTVREAIESHVGDLEGLGWHVEVADAATSLHRFFKNGKPRKTGDVSLWFDEFVTESFDDFDGRGMQTIQRPSQRPYHVTSVRVPTRSFTTLSRALLAFLDEAKELAPRR